jgi:hypothetical protein
VIALGEQGSRIICGISPGAQNGVISYLSTRVTQRAAACWILSLTRQAACAYGREAVEFALARDENLVLAGSAGWFQASAEIWPSIFGVLTRRQGYALTSAVFLPRISGAFVIVNVVAIFVGERTQCADHGIRRRLAQPTSWCV